MYKAVILLCLKALLMKSITAQCIGAYNGLIGDGYGWGGAAVREIATPYAPYAPYGAIEYGVGFVPAASNGGGFAVTSISPIAPTGVYVTSENAYDGAVAVTGRIPFLSAVALEGSLPTLGAGTISYGCGNGNIGIMSEDIAPAGYSAPAGYGSPLGYGAPVAALGYGGAIGYNGYGAGCGCGGLY